MKKISIQYTQKKLKGQNGNRSLTTNPNEWKCRAMATALQVSHIDRDLKHQSRRKELWTPSGKWAN